MRTVREPAVAGLFYPDNPQVLDNDIDKYLSGAPANENDSVKHLKTPKAIIVPHAGYVYSGLTAAKAFNELLPSADKIRRVVLLGPSHRVGFEGIAFCSSDFFRTPLGEIPIDHSALVAISDLSNVGLLDRAHEQEHSLEVQLPFLQKVLRDFKLVPLVVGDTDTQTVARVIERLWGDDSTLFVISSDLSHYHDYRTAQRMDSATCNAIEHLAADAIGFEQACGRNPVKGLLDVARHRHMDVKTLAMCNSGDTSGDHDRVVGYGAWGFWEA
ncbi:MAG: AmmeMemoRadiSam system protein B [Pseudomonadales bacterium]|nr:AmmeMemoRadiSam system protein B [Pseudomonadales bacterium]